MNRLLIKVCGMRENHNIRDVAGLMPDLMGFVFFPASPRYIGESPVNGVAGSLLQGILKTGVFVDADLYEIKAIVLRFGLQAVQLHGNESPGMCKQLRASGLKVIKAFRMAGDFDFSNIMPFVSCSDWFLFDTATKIPGGSGVRFNWKLLEDYDLGHPFFLSGGMDLGDVDKILALNHPSFVGVDINSKFEIEPGVKDVQKVERFIRGIRNI